MKNTPFDLTGQIAVITGSSRGIGRASAELLAQLGAKVVISSRKADACEEVADGIRKSGKFVGQQSIQLHGGIGMTQEAKIGHYFKRLTMIENTFGDTDYHLRRVTDAGGLV